MRSILTLSKTCDVDAKFAKEVSSSSRKGKMQMQLYRSGRLKSICKFKEKSVADYIGLKKSIRNSEYQVSADTMVAIKASVQANWQILGQMRSRRQINLYEKIKVYPHHFCKSKMLRIFKIKINGYNKWLVQYPRVLIRRWLRVF